MAITQISGTDSLRFIGGDTIPDNTEVVVAVNPDGSVIGGGGSQSSPTVVGGEYNSTPPTLTNGQTDALQSDSRGNLKVSLVVADGTATPAIPAAGADAVSNTSSGLIVYARAAVYNGTNWDRQKKPGSTARLVSAAASTNATSVKTSAGDVFRITGFNANAAARYIKLYNLAVAPTVGTSTPVWTEYLAPQAKFIIDFPTPLYFSTGISYALTTGSADSDTGALTAGDVLAMNIAYQ